MPWQALATLGGGIIGAFGQHATNRQNMRIAQMNNQYNRMMMQEQNKWNLDHWHRMNAYNDPSEQRKRLEKAGINPAIALGSISPGQAEALTSAGASPAETPQLSNAMQPLADGITNSMNQYLQAKGLEAQVRKTQAETDAINIDNKTRADINENTKESGKLDNQLKSEQISSTVWERLRSQGLYEYEKQELSARILNTEKDTAVKESQRLLNMFDLEHIKPAQRKLMQVQAQHTYQAIALMIQQGQVLKSQIPLLGAQLAKTMADTAQVQANTKTIDAVRDYSVKKLEQEFDNLVKDGKLKEQDIKYRPDRELRENLSSAVNVVNGVSNVVDSIIPF